MNQQSTARAKTTTVQEAEKIIDNAINELRGLAEKALQNEDFTSVAAVAQLAEGLRGIRSTGKASVDTPVRADREPKAKTKKRSYPTFERDGDKLVKIGWSKKAREEYRHRTPRTVPFALLKRIEANGNARVFRTAEIFPIEGHDGEAIPDYQAHMALKWFHHEGLISKHGRDGYSPVAGRLTEGVLSERWENLPTRKGDVK